MPAKTVSRILVRYDPRTGVLTLVEDGQVDLSPLGRLLSRRRVGQIDPSPTDPNRLDLVMQPHTPQARLVGSYATKREAVAAEVDEARKLLATTSNDNDGKVADQQQEVATSGDEDKLPATGAAVAYCPCCRHPLSPTVKKLRRRDALGNLTRVYFKCRCVESQGDGEEGA